MDLTLRNLVYKGPVVGGSIVIRNGRRLVLLKPECEGRMHAEYLVQCSHRMVAKNSYQQHI